MKTKFRKFKLTFEQEYYDEDNILMKVEPQTVAQIMVSEQNFDSIMSEDYIVRNYLDKLANKIKMELVTKKK